MLIVDKMIVGGVRFVLDKLSVAVEQELNDDTSLREELLAAQMRVELGEMTQEEFSALEDEVLAAIREIRERTGKGGGPIEMGGGAPSEGGDGQQRTLGAADIASIDASFVADDYYGDEPAAEAVVDVTASAVPKRSAPSKKPARGERAANAPRTPKPRGKAPAGRKPSPPRRRTK